jgi:hypothetical protein
MTATEAPAAYQPFEAGARVAFTDGHRPASRSFRALSGNAVVVGFRPYVDGKPGGWYTLERKGETISVEARNVAAYEPKAKGAPGAKVAKPAPETLPKIVAMVGKSDSGEYGNATCPHCGADGRYVWTFRCDDGTTRGAMAGCIKLFPRSALVDEHQRLLDRLDERQAKGQTLASWDQAKLAAIEAVVAGRMTEAEALLVVKVENAKRTAWMDRRGRR